jgi:hypothetical protein
MVCIPLGATTTVNVARPVPLPDSATVTGWNPLTSPTLTDNVNVVDAPAASIACRHRAPPLTAAQVHPLPAFPDEPATIGAGNVTVTSSGPAPAGGPLAVGALGPALPGSPDGPVDGVAPGTPGTPKEPGPLTAG